MKGLSRSLSRAPANKRTAAPRVFAATAATVSITGASGVGYGTIVIGGLPEGNLLFQGAVAYVTVDENGSASVSDTFNGDFSVGTTPASDGTLTGADVNIVGSTVLGPAVSGVTPEARGTNATAAVIDNTDGSAELNLNILIDDADISADVDLLVTYRVALSFVVLGDD